MKMSESITKIAPALVKFNAEVSKISKDASNPFHKNKYSTLDQIIDEVRPTLQKHGLTVMQNASGEDGNITVKTFLLHESGEWMESEGVTLKPQKNDPQGAGGAVTYARRYDICAFLSLNTGDDDDGNTASGLNKPKQQPENDPLNEKLTVTFSEALQSVGDKAKLYEQLGTNGDAMKKLLNSKKKAEKEKLIKTLEGIAHDNRNAG